MLHFLAKLGKKSWAPTVAPIISGTTASGYLMFHIFGHQTVRNFLVARDNSGLNVQLTDHVKSLITETYNDLEDKLFKDVFDFPGMETKKNPIRWFASSTMEPVTVGLSDTRSGFIVGLPFFFNYAKTMDIPDSMIRFKTLRFFKRMFEDPEGDKIDQTIDRTKFRANQDLIPPWESAIDRKDPIVKSYLDSMILSDNAMRFAIARELYLGDSYKPLLRAACMLFCSGVAIAFSRVSVAKLDLKKLHISRRLGVYGIAATFAYVQYNILSATIDSSYTKKCDLAAIESGEKYRLGAIEYLEKMRTRNQALYKLFSDAREVFWPNGDRRNGLVRKPFEPIEERLSWTMVQDIEEKFEGEKEQKQKQEEETKPSETKT